MNLMRNFFSEDDGHCLDYSITVSLRQGLKLALVVFALVFASVLGANLATVASFYATRAINITVEVADD